MTDPVLVELPALVGRQLESWQALIEISPDLGEHWLLVGGQMVFLHEIERRSTTVRPTNDIDVVVDLRVDPAGLDRMHTALINAQFTQDLPSPDGLAHRYRRDGAAFDVLAPDHIGKRARLRLGSGRTVEAPGTSQAFTRSAVISVVLATGESGSIRRPTLMGALLGKIAAVTEIVSQSAAERAKHLRDLDALARLVGTVDRESSALTRRERDAVRRVADLAELSALGTRSLRQLQ